jgi:hypothetical protein
MRFLNDLKTLVVGSIRVVPDGDTASPTTLATVALALEAEANTAPTSKCVATSTPCWQTARHSAGRHAERLLRWLNDEGLWDEYRFPELLEMYQLMCLELNWAVRPWNPVGAALTRLTTGKKIYRWFRRDRHNNLSAAQVGISPRREAGSERKGTCASSLRHCCAFCGRAASSNYHLGREDSPCTKTVLPDRR